MLTTLPGLDWDKLIEGLEPLPDQKVSDATSGAFTKLREHYRAGLLTPEEVDSFRHQASGVGPDLQPRLLGLKAILLLESGKIDEALKSLQEAYSIHNQEGHNQEGGVNQKLLKNHLLSVWSAAAIYQGLSGIQNRSSTTLRKGVEEYLSVLETARAEGVEDAVIHLPLESDNEELPQETYEALEELELAIRLLSIKNPFEGWRALSKEISKVWPKDVSAVDAIREQRNR